MSSPSPRVVIFDLDRTITQFGTFTPFLVRYASVHRTWALVFAPLVPLLMLAYKLKIISRGRLKELMTGFLIGGASRQKLCTFASDFAQWALENHSFPDAKRMIAKHKVAGDYLILATASFDFTAAAFAKALGFHEVIATLSCWNNDVLKSQIAGRNCYGDEKERRVKEAVTSRGLSLDQSVFYTDHHSDIVLLDKVTSPIVVNPTAKLERWARAHPKAIIMDWQAD